MLQALVARVLVLSQRHSDRDNPLSVVLGDIVEFPEFHVSMRLLLAFPCSSSVTSTQCLSPVASPEGKANESLSAGTSTELSAYRFGVFERLDWLLGMQLSVPINDLEPIRDESVPLTADTIALPILKEW